MPFCIVWRKKEKKCLHEYKVNPFLDIKNVCNYGFCEYDIQTVPEHHSREKNPDQSVLVPSQSVNANFVSRMGHIVVVHFFV